MALFLSFLVILAISFFLALESMKDFDSANEVRGYIRRKKKGTIVFLKDKVKHYSS